jgi:hypothetical protein
MSSLDAIIFINLDHRGDRKIHILNEIKKIDPTFQKTQRISACYIENNGAIGCSLSHIKALELCLQHPEWKKCLILEDDFTFSSTEFFEELLLACPVFDMLLLAIGSELCELTEVPNIYRILSSQTTSGYVVHQKYINTLLDNIREGYNLLCKIGKPEYNAIDQYWKKIMQNGLWYSHKNKIGYQYANYSDIEKKYCDYGC